MIEVPLNFLVIHIMMFSVILIKKNNIILFIMKY